MRVPAGLAGRSPRSPPLLRSLFPKEPWLHYNGSPGRNQKELYDLYAPTLHQLGSLEPGRLATALEKLDTDPRAARGAWNHALSSPYSGSNSPPKVAPNETLEKALLKMTSLSLQPLKRIWSGDQHTQPVVAYLLPKLVYGLAKAGRTAPALRILERYAKLANTDRTRLAVAMGANAILCAQPPNADLICRVIDIAKPICEFGFVPEVQKSLDTIPAQDQPRILRKMLDAKMDLSSNAYCGFLRTLCSSSDAGGEAVALAARTTALPPQFYQFLMNFLSRSGDSATIDLLCDETIPKLATSPHKIGRVLHLVLLRTLESGDLQKTAQVLARWPIVVPERTWMRIFQRFRYLGRPDKCEETLRCALRQHQKLRAPFIGEYLTFYSQFYNVGMFGEALLTVAPELSSVLQKLELLPYFSGAPLLTGSMPLLRPDQWIKPAQGIEASWIDITYRAVLNGIEDAAEIRRLYDAYANNSVEGGPLSMRTIDQFVERLVVIRTPLSIKIAEQILRDALSRLPLTLPSNGSYNCRSVEALSDALTHPVHGDVERALRLVSDVFAHPAIAKRGRALAPVFARLDPERQAIFRQWAESLGAVI